MDVTAILKLMKEMKNSGISTLEWSADGQKLTLTRPDEPTGPDVSSALAQAIGQLRTTDLPRMDGPTIGETSDTTEASEEKTARPAGRIVASPVVGIFYAAPSPDQDPFVTIGKSVEAGTPLGIIEAMKLMNEVVSPCPGVIVDILVENAQRVEYGQPLFVIEERQS